MNDSSLTDILARLARGEIDVDHAAKLLHQPPDEQRGLLRTSATSDALVDLDRQRRCGFPEVVFGQGKTPESVLEIFETQRRHGIVCFGTRISPEQAERILARFPEAISNPAARTIRIGETPPEDRRGHVAVVTAGTSDRPVAEEALETLHWMGCGTDLIVDVGVAGPHRLQEQLPRLEAAQAIVVVAGMEGALPSVVGGFVSAPVIAVPTSVGYGASFGGLAALLGMLNSCAANVTVVNIDAGFKAGYVAGLIARS